ncbi:MAG: hypothetical protein CMN76_09785 [Spirochaetaceae bacterium]|nr:hypothetical protein [Spirochaetaceae bacterium]|tara:strand:+ start:369 stop:6800 length:6432 start_codon:yes stop_codon:yes gene_type:complete
MQGQYVTIPEISSGPWGYFWQQLPYAIPGFVSLAVGISLFAFSIWFAVSRRDRWQLHLSLGFTALTFGWLGGILSLGALVQNLSLLGQLYHWLAHPAVFLGVAVSLGFYNALGRRPVFLISALVLLVVALWVLLSVLQGQVFTDQWHRYDFGFYPAGSLSFVIWGASLTVFYGLIALPYSIIEFLRRRRKGQPWPTLLVALNLLMVLAMGSLPAFAGLEIYPAGGLLFLPLALLAYGAARDEALDLQDLLFKRNGLFYIIAFSFSLICMALAVLTALLLAPGADFESQASLRTLIPLFSMAVTLGLAVYIGGTNPGDPLHMLGAGALTLIGTYSLILVIMDLGLPLLVTRRLEQILYLAFALIPSVQLRFAFRIMNRPLPGLVHLIDLLSGLSLSLVLTPVFFGGFWVYSFGMISEAGPGLQLMAVNGFLAVGTVIAAWWGKRKQVSIEKAETMAVLALALGGILTLTNLPATVGISLYPLGSLQFLPGIMLAYAILRKGILRVSGGAVTVSNVFVALSMVAILGVLFVHGISFLEEVSYGRILLHLCLVGVPLGLSAYSGVFVGTRTIARRLDASYAQLEEANRIADAEKRIALESSEEANALAEIGRKINETTDLDAILSTVFSHMAEAYGATRIAIQLVDEAESELRTVHYDFLGGAHTEAQRDFIRDLIVPLNPESGTLYRTYARQRPLYLPPREGTPWYETRREDGSLEISEIDQKIASTLELVSLAQFPLLIQGRTIGVLWCSFGMEKRSKSDIESMLRFCGQIAGAIHNSKLLQQLESQRNDIEQARREVEKLADISRQLGETSDYQELVQTVAKFVFEEFQIDGAILMMENRSRESLASVHTTMPQAADPAIPEFARSMEVPLESESALSRVFRRGRSLYSPRILESVDFPAIDREIVRGLQLSWYFAVPIIAQGNSVGLLLLSTYDRKIKLDRQQRERIQRYCQQIAGALYSATLISELTEEKQRAQDALYEVSVLSEMSRRLNEAESLDDVTDFIFAHLKQTFEARAAGLLLVDEPQNRLFTVRAATMDPGGPSNEMLNFSAPLNQESGTLYRTFVRQKPLYVPRVSGGFGTEVDRYIAETLELESFAHIPLVSLGQTIGIIWISFDGRRRKRQEIDRLERFASQIAGAVQKSSLLEQVVQARDQAERERRLAGFLADVSRELNESRNLETVTDLVLSHLETEFGLTNQALLLVNEESQTLRIVDSRLPDADPKWVRDFEAKLDITAGTLFRTYKRQKPLYLDRKVDVEGAGPVDTDIRNNISFQRFIQLPLVALGKTVGILFGGQKEEDAGFSRTQIKEMEAFAQQIAGAIHHQRLLEETVKANQLAEREKQKALDASNESRDLAEFTRKINESSDLEGILDEVFSHIRSTYEVDSIVLQMADQARNELYTMKYSSDRLEHGSEEERFTAGLVVPLRKESGTLFRTYTKQKPFYMPPRSNDPDYLKRATGGVVSELDKEISERLDLKSLAQFPLVVQKETIGILWCSLGEQKRSSQQIESISRFCSQIAGAIHSTRLMNQLQEEKERVEQSREATDALRQLAEQASSITSQAEMVDLVLDFAQKQFGLSYFGFLLLDEKGQNLIHYRSRAGGNVPEEATRRIKESGIPFDGEQSIVAQAVRKKKTLYLPRIPGASRSLDAQLLMEGKARSLIAVPMWVEEEPLGVFLASQYDQPLKLSRDQINQMEAFCNQVSGVIRSIRLLEQTEKARKEAEAAREETEILADIAREANQATTMLEILSALHRVARRRFAADSTVLWIVNEIDGELSPEATLIRGESWAQRELPEILRSVPLRPECGNLYLTYAKKRAFHFSDLKNPRVDRHMMPVDRAVRDFAAMEWFINVPLIVEGQVIGILGITGPESRKLSQREISLCERLGAQLAGAVRASSLLKETAMARAESDRLLANILPAEVADELKREGQVQPRQYESVSVLFTDFAGFTSASASMAPEELVSQLDSCFSQFDQIVKRNGLEKLKTIGDAYMAAGGLPAENLTHAIDACLAALEFRQFMKQVEEVRASVGEKIWKIRIGIHSGPVTAGVLGTDKFAYDIWGDTVNTASRMESSGEPGRVNISRETYELVKDLFEVEARGKVQAKGKGELEMFFLTGIKPEFSVNGEGLIPNGKFEMKRQAV